MYKKIIKPILFLFDPEKVHEFFVNTGEFFGRFRITRWAVGLIFNYKGKDISKTVDGIKYRTPILLSAGFDYNARLTSILASISFGGAEIGSITAKYCPGNKTPRLTRLPNSKSIIVNKGLKNEGVDKIISRLQKIKQNKIENFVVGVSIARTNTPECNTIELGVEDYYESFEKLNTAEVGDYYTINISCPNAFCGETFTDPLNLNKLFNKLDTVKVEKPVYVKMPISVTDEIFSEILDVLSNHKVDGVIIGNLQKNYDHINDLDHKPEKYSGGLSGKPCESRSNELIKITKEKRGDRFTIIGCGGIFSYIDYKKKIDAGADLVHLITGMIFEGPGLIKKICKGIERENE